MRFIGIWFTVGALVLAGIFGGWSMHAYAGCAAVPTGANCLYDRHMFSIALLVFMASLAGIGAYLTTKSHHA